MRTVTLELLRHGPPHNQLLSPLTPYLALCENHGPVTLNLDFEHHQFLHRLSALTYEVDNAAQRRFQLRDTGLELGKVLGAVPGLIAELSRDNAEASGVLHLRLVLSASELALLPFELALAGNGMPGDGQPLALQNQVPLCVTREVRRVREPGLRWGDDQIRVLFACASPADLPAVPLESHLLALRRAVSPWVGVYESNDDEQRREQVDLRLRVLPRATLRDIERECANGEFTHVHILAHGVLQAGRGLQPAFGLALHDAADPDGPSDIVSGERLASALRPMKQPPCNAVNRPHVVTLASCNAAQVASVIGGGASIAHALHEAGIPLVLAGQFPLSFAGSVRLVEVMYEGLLWGVDPRELLTNLRRRLHSMALDNHDWASLVAYAALPDDFDEQIARQRVQAAKGAIDTAMEFADRVTASFGGPLRRRRGGGAAAQTMVQSDEQFQMLRRAHQKIDVPRQRLERLLDSADLDRRHHILGLLASAEKRHAEVKFWAARRDTLAEDKREQFQAEARELVVTAQRRYWQCFRAKPGQCWATVQYIALALLLRGWPRKSDERDVEVDEGELAPEKLRALWLAAKTLSQHDLDTAEKRSSWALGNLIELALLELLLPQQTPRAATTIDRDARDLTERLLNSPQADRFQIYSTQRQLRRYVDWFVAVNESFGAPAKLASKLLVQMRDDPASLARPPTR